MPFTHLNVCKGSVKYAAERLLASESNALKEYARTLLMLPDHLISISRKEVEHAEAKVHLLDPVNILKRGYSITFFEGRPVKDINAVKKPDIISTRLSNGTITSIVEDIQSEDQRE